MDLTTTPYKHLKLDKFVYGSKQKIIKTTTQIISKDENLIVNYQANKKNVYYFSDLDNNLLDFHLINFDYVNNKRNKLTLNSYIDNYNPTFSISANIIKHYTTLQDGQRIAYFPLYIYTPLDITQFKNSCYFLLPISTNKFVNIAHLNSILNDVLSFNLSPMPEDLSSNIKPHLQFYDKAAYTSEDNCIPVYDMNFELLQTIKFPSINELYIWLIKWGLQDIIYQDSEDNYHSLINEIMFDSSRSMSFEELANNDLPTDNCDSIKLLPLINYLMNKKYIYSRLTMNKMLSLLFGNLATSSMLRYFKLVGRINTLDVNTSGDIYKSIKSDLNKEGVYNVWDLLTKKQDVTFTQTVLPQNTLLIDSTLDGLVYDDLKLDKLYFPSCYINFVNLKNSRDPLYQLNCTIGDYKVDNNIFTTDKRFSIEYNNINNSSNYLSTMNEQMTVLITNKAVLYDDNLATNEGYTNLFPQRMSVKQRHYLNQYNDKHLCNNVLSSMGTLDGIRNYLHVGTSFNKNVWLSYSYNLNYNAGVFDDIALCGIVNKNNSFNTKVYLLPFHSYSLNRDQLWIKDYNGNNKTTCIMKSYGIECPWGALIQSGLLCCNLLTGKMCSGFCTFPCNGQIKQSFNDNRGRNWKLNLYFGLNDYNEDVKAKMNNSIRLASNNLWFVIPSSEFLQILLANEDIRVNDDIEVFITSSSFNTNTLFSDVVSNITLLQELKSIFQGFWNKGKFALFRYTDNNYDIAKNSKFNGPHIITKDTVINNYYDLNNNCLINHIPSGYYCLIRVKSWWSDTIRCEGSIKVILNNLTNLNDIINKYDFIETIDGFFKFKQTGLHKSNIYSINLKNTGLSKDGDKEIKLYTKKLLIKLLENKHFIRYYLDEDSFLVNSDLNAFIHAIFNSKENTTYKRTPLFKDLLHNNLSGFILNYVTIPFLNLIQYEGIVKKDNELIYYYEKEYQEAVEYNEVRLNIRLLILKAIRKSITRYMPADTNLWKVEYLDED